jgi:hypothetical protein
MNNETASGIFYKIIVDQAKERSAAVHTKNKKKGDGRESPEVVENLTFLYGIIGYTVNVKRTS